jgi:trans-AT polyketide synthase, acyltransferase and oxidoreductase domains
MTILSFTKLRTLESSAIILPTALGDSQFRADYDVRYAYIVGAMYKGIASHQMIIAMGRANLMSYFGTGGLSLSAIDAAIGRIQGALQKGEPYGMNLLCNIEHPEIEEQTVELFLKSGVRCVEAAAFMTMTPALVRYRVAGLHRDQNGRVLGRNRILAKVSRPEIAALFMQPPPDSIVLQLLERGLICTSEAELCRSIPMAEDICVESDSGGHTDRGVASALMPVMFALRDEMMQKHTFDRRIRVGAAGGIGTPHAAAVAFVMGADFVLTGSINQCTVEAGTSEAVKEMLQVMRIQDTGYAPAGDMFEIGAKVQVLKKGSLFATRANKLYELYQRYASLDEIDERTRTQIQEKYFKRSFSEVWDETKRYYLRAHPQKLRDIENNPKRVMGLIFKWYFAHSTRLALEGSEGQQIDYQVHCGPAMGAFNQWVKDTELQCWRDRHVDHIAELIMTNAAHFLNQRFAFLSGSGIKAT